MSNSLPEIDDPDFGSQMEKLVAQAAQKVRSQGGQTGQNPRIPAPERQGGAMTEPPAGRGAAPGGIKLEVAEAMRPLLAAVEALTRAIGQQRQSIEQLEAAQKHHEKLVGAVDATRNALDERNAIDERMFDALHEELKTYKDGFLLDVLHKPVINGLMTLYDDVCELHRQVEECVQVDGSSPAEGPCYSRDFLPRLRTNLDHYRHALLEILSRMGVEQIEMRGKKLDRKLQKAVAVENALSVEEDNLIVQRLRAGFTWRDRVFRPEEVVIKKYREGSLIALPKTSGTDDDEESGVSQKNQ